MTGKLCGGKKRQGEGNCARPAGWGTDHPGFGACKLHGGSTPNAGKAAAHEQQQEIAAKAVLRYSLPRDVDPATALLEEVHRSAGAVAYLTSVVNELQGDDPVKDVLVENTIGGHQPVVWLRLLQAERAHLAKVAKTALDAGIAERQVKAMEQLGSALVSFVRGLVAALGLDPDAPAVREIVSTQMRALSA